MSNLIKNKIQLDMGNDLDNDDGTHEFFARFGLFGRDETSKIRLLRDR